MPQIVSERNTSNKEKMRVILSLAVPAMIENILQTAVGFVDTLFVAKLGLCRSNGGWCGQCHFGRIHCTFSRIGQSK